MYVDHEHTLRRRDVDATSWTSWRLPGDLQPVAVTRDGVVASAPGRDQVLVLHRFDGTSAALDGPRGEFATRDSQVIWSDDHAVAVGRHIIDTRAARAYAAPSSASGLAIRDGRASWRVSDGFVWATWGPTGLETRRVSFESFWEVSGAQSWPLADGLLILSSSYRAPDLHPRTFGRLFHLDFDGGEREVMASAYSAAPEPDGATLVVGASEPSDPLRLQRIDPDGSITPVGDLTPRLSRVRTLFLGDDHVIWTDRSRRSAAVLSAPWSHAFRAPHERAALPTDCGHACSFTYAADGSLGHVVDRDTLVVHHPSGAATTRIPLTVDRWDRPRLETLDPPWAVVDHGSDALPEIDVIDLRDASSRRFRVGEYWSTVQERRWALDSGILYRLGQIHPTWSAREVVREDLATGRVDTVRLPACTRPRDLGVRGAWLRVTCGDGISPETVVWSQVTGTTHRFPFEPAFVREYLLGNGFLLHDAGFDTAWTPLGPVLDWRPLPGIDGAMGDAIISAGRRASVGWISSGRALVAQLPVAATEPTRPHRTVAPATAPTVLAATAYDDELFVELGDADPAEELLGVHIHMAGIPSTGSGSEVIVAPGQTEVRIPLHEGSFLPSSTRTMTVTAENLRGSAETTYLVRYGPPPVPETPPVPAPPPVLAAPPPTAPIVARAPRFSVRWGATPGAVAHQRRTRVIGLAGRPGPWRVSSPTAGTPPTLRQRVAPGRTSCTAARAINSAGVPGPWSPAACTSRSVDDRALTRGDGWRRVRDREAQGRSLLVSSRHGASLRLEADGVQVVWVWVRICRGCGRAQLWMGPHRVRSIGTRAPRTTIRRFRLSGFAPTSGPVRIRVTGQGKPVGIDGVAVRPWAAISAP